MELLIKAAALGITGSLLALVVKKSNPEMSLLLALAVCLPLAYMALVVIGELTDFIKEAAGISGVSAAYLSPMLKCVGLGLVTKLASDLCRDAGQSSVASAVELTGGAAALLVALPILKTLLTMIEGLA